VTFAGIANFIYAILFEKISGVTWTARGIGAFSIWWFVVLDRLHVLHLVAATRPHLQSGDLRVRESRGCGFF